MNIDWVHFTPFASLAGGIILGVASAIFILVNGRILGISGILGGLLPPKRGDTFWRVSFLLGFAAAPMVFHAVVPTQYISAPRIDATEMMVVIAGLLTRRALRRAGHLNKIRLGPRLPGKFAPACQQGFTLRLLCK
jgi:hypothetical protein